METSRPIKERLVLSPCSAGFFKYNSCPSIRDAEELSGMGVKGICITHEAFLLSSEEDSRKMY